MSSSRPDRLALPVSAAALLAGMSLLLRESRATIGGAWGFPLDDSYIHAALARTLAESGTWGVRDSAFVSASSSPAYTALLAALFALFHPTLWIPLAVNAAAGVAVLSVAARVASAQRLPTLLAVVALGPLPYLAGLGMEHVVHAALVLGIVTLTDAPATGRRVPALLLLCAVAPVVRYESLFVVGVVATMLWFERRPGLSIGVLAAGASLVGAFGLWSVAKGGLPLPNSLLMKTGLVDGLSEQLRRNVAEGAPVIVLAAAAMVLASTERDRRRGGMFAACTLLQIALAGIGWLHRYEGWLVIWGLVLVVPRLVEATGGRAWRALLLLLVLGPGAWRAWGAWSTFAPSSLAIHAGDGALARMVGARHPTATVAVHDIGVLAWSTSAPILDLAGLATTEITRLHLAHRLDGPAIQEIVAREGVEIAWADERWMPGDLPPSFVEVAEVYFPLPGGAEATTRVWVTRTELADAVERSLLTMAATERSTRVSIVGALHLDLAEVEAEGDAVVREQGELAFYTNGVARFTAPVSGTLTLVLRGTIADGRGPRLRVITRAGGVDFIAGLEPRQVDGPAVEAGEVVELHYADDQVDSAGMDRNLWIGGLHIRPDRPNVAPSAGR